MLRGQSCTAVIFPAQSSRFRVVLLPPLSYR